MKIENTRCFVFFFSNKMSTFYNCKKTQNLQKQIVELKKENKLLIEKTDILEIIQKEFSKRKIEYVCYHCMLIKLLLFFFFLLVITDTYRFKYMCNKI